MHADLALLRDFALYDCYVALQRSSFASGHGGERNADSFSVKLVACSILLVNDPEAMAPDSASVVEQAQEVLRRIMRIEPWLNSKIWIMMDARKTVGFDRLTDNAALPEVPLLVDAE